LSNIKSFPAAAAAQHTDDDDDTKKKKRRNEEKKKEENKNLGVLSHARQRQKDLKRRTRISFLFQLFVLVNS
jgi:hypothetical protein